jgi:hypothetical protein
VSREKIYERRTQKHLEEIAERAARLADGGGCDFFCRFDCHSVDSRRV